MLELEPSIAGSCPTLYENGGGHKDHQRSSLPTHRVLGDGAQPWTSKTHAETPRNDTGLYTQQVGIDEIGTAHP